MQKKRNKSSSEPSNIKIKKSDSRDFTDHDSQINFPIESRGARRLDMRKSAPKIRKKNPIKCGATRKSSIYRLSGDRVPDHSARLYFAFHSEIESPLCSCDALGKRATSGGSSQAQRALNHFADLIARFICRALEFFRVSEPLEHGNYAVESR
jgi:hypothetical protein